jgi:hypothetical protein
MRIWSSTQEFIIVEVTALSFEEFLPKAGQVIKTLESLVEPVGASRCPRQSPGGPASLVTDIL